MARRAMLSAMGPAGVVFGLFHTLVDTEHRRPVGFEWLRVPEPVSAHSEKCPLIC